MHAVDLSSLVSIMGGNHSGLTQISSHSILACPFTGGGFVLGPIGLVDVRDFWDKGIVGVSIRQESTDREQNLSDGECR